MLGVTANGSDSNRRWILGGVALSVYLDCDCDGAWLLGHIPVITCGD
jgi:hypothetical protein